MTTSPPATGWLLLALLVPLPSGPAAAQRPNTLTAAERKEGWTLLFDGRTTHGWRGFQSDTIGAGWQVREGALARVAAGGNIITTRQYGDFDLQLEWKISPGGNSGIMYRVTEEAEAPYETGPEMQVLDDARHADGGSPLTSAGSCFGLYPAPRGVVKPAGEWNAARIVVRGSHVEHWLNGVKMVEYELGSDEWAARVAGSKFAQWPGFGKAPRGYIALQDHGDEVAYRNIRIRELKSAAQD